MDKEKKKAEQQKVRKTVPENKDSSKGDKGEMSESDDDVVMKDAKVSSVEIELSIGVSWSHLSWINPCRVCVKCAYQPSMLIWITILFFVLLYGTSGRLEGWGVRHLLVEWSVSVTYNVYRGQ